MFKKLFLVLLVFLAYLGLAFFLQPKLRQVLRVAQPKTATISTGPKQVESLFYDCQPGKNAFELLSQKTQGNLETKDYPFGKMINSVNGVAGGSDGKYWIYFIDGKSATVSADNYKCQDKEKVEWKLTTSN